MALIKCEECGTEVSDRASACPKCGCPIRNEKLNEESQPKKSEENVQQSQKFSGRPWRPNKGNIIGGILFIILSLYLTQSLLPEYKLPDAKGVFKDVVTGNWENVAGEAIDIVKGKEYFSEDDYNMLMNIAWGLGILGLIGVVSGSFHRAAVGFCKTCDREVTLVESTFVGRKCELCNGRVGKFPIAIYILLGFVLLLLIVLFGLYL